MREETPLPQTMKAAIIRAYGSPGAIRMEETPVPRPGPGELLLRVESAGVNFSDVMRRRGDPYPFPTNFPFTVGGEVAGTVVALGAGVTEPPVGTRVFATVGYGGPGGYAQFAVARQAQTVPIPPGMTEDEACSLVVAGGTAILTLSDAARLQPGESVFIQAAAGGVGSYAVQLAKAMGAGTILASVSSEEKGEWAKSLGADHVLSTGDPEWPARMRERTGGRGADIIMEATGGQTLEQGLSCLAPFGRIVVYGLASGEAASVSQAALHRMLYAPAPNQSLISFNLGLYFEHRMTVAVTALERLIGHILRGEVRVPIGLVLPLDEAARAHALLEGRQSKGKIVLKPWA